MLLNVARDGSSCVDSLNFQHIRDQQQVISTLLYMHDKFPSRYSYKCLDDDEKKFCVMLEINMILTRNGNRIAEHYGRAHIRGFH